MTTDTPAAAPITAEREAFAWMEFERQLAQEYERRDIALRKSGEWWPNERDWFVAGARFVRAALSAPVAAPSEFEKTQIELATVSREMDVIYERWGGKEHRTTREQLLTPLRERCAAIGERRYALVAASNRAAPVAAPTADPLLGQALAALVRYANACDADAKTVAVIQALEARIDAAPVFHLRSFGDVTADELERLTAAPPAASGVDALWVDDFNEFAEFVMTHNKEQAVPWPIAELFVRTVRAHLSTALTGAVK